MSQDGSRVHLGLRTGAQTTHDTYQESLSIFREVVEGVLPPPVSYVLMYDYTITRFMCTYEYVSVCVHEDPPLTLSDLVVLSLLNRCEWWWRRFTKRMS